MEERSDMNMNLKNDQTQANSKEKKDWSLNEQQGAGNLMELTWKEYLSQFIIHHIGVGNLS
jgi:hypothetical protein